nr:transcription factor DIVARICATA [Oryza sativa Japonica Group]
MPPPPVQQADDHNMNNVVADAGMNYYYGGGGAGGAMVFGGAPMGETVEQAAPPVPVVPVVMNRDDDEVNNQGGGRHRAAPTNTTRRFWTTEEHRQFLRGLRVYGRGEWKSISMNFVRSKTPVQVSSHAQKYFRRVESAAADKQRYSINDVGLNDDTAAMDGTNSYSNNNFGGWQSLIQQQFMQMQAQTQQAWNDQHMMMAAAPMEGATDTNFEPAEQQHVLNF